MTRPLSGRMTSVLALLALVMAGWWAPAATQISTGSIVGTVLDPSGQIALKLKF